VDPALRAWGGLDRARRLAPRPADEEELRLVHQASHLARIMGADGRTVSLDPDTCTSPLSVQTALRAAGSLLDLCDAALRGEVEHGMALVRPPGHHAAPNRAMGFCLFNNAALAAAHLVRVRGLDRVMVVDWDVHHGNGTEDVFYQDERVLYFSTHQWPFYPGSGPLTALGQGAGEGYNINVPLPGGRRDADFIRIFEDLLKPVILQYNPGFILVSAGFDAHADDPLGGMRISDLGFAALTRVLMEAAEECCPGRIVMTLEGGYDVMALGRSVVAVLEALTGSLQADELRREAADACGPASLIDARNLAGKYWELS
jgi:acetoin utilization deacetylase AcuC-like enzyme